MKKFIGTTLNGVEIYTIENDGHMAAHAAITVFTAFSGAKAPREPWDSDISTAEEKSEAEEFWRTHALVYDESAIDTERN